MKSHGRLARQPRQSGGTQRLRWLALLAFTAITGCGAFDNGFKREWTEDVLLDDRTTIVLKRFVDVEETNSWAGDAYNAVEREAKIAFTGNLAALPEWSFPLRALVLYRSEANGEWAIVATSASTDDLAQYGEPRFLFEPDRPRTNLLEFRLRGSRWVRAPLSRESTGRRANLLFKYKNLSYRHVNADRRRGLNGGDRVVPTYHQVGVDLRSHSYLYTQTQWIWQAEDRILTALDEQHATDDEREKVVELIGGMSFPMIRLENFDTANWKPDTDSQTVQLLIVPGANQGHSSVSTDGQAMYRAMERNSPDDELFWQVYSIRLKAAGFGRFIDNAPKGAHTPRHWGPD
jgi:hypothetical protein